MPLRHGRHPRRRRDRRRAASSGLFAAGECAGGLSGATRLGGNSLSDLLVFGRRAGEAAAEYAGRAELPAVADADVAAPTAELEALLPADGDEDAYALHGELQQTMQRNVGIYRDQAGLETALGDDRGSEAARPERARRRRRAALQHGLAPLIDLRNMLVCAEAIARAALGARSRAARTAGSTSRRRRTTGAAAASSSRRAATGWRSRRSRS